MLPQMPNNIQQRESRMVAIRGLNYTDNYNEGNLAYSKNISARRFPYITTAVKRNDVASDASMIGSWNELFTIKSGNLYYGERNIGAVGGEVTQMVMVNTRLVLWPVKKYVDMNTMTIKDLEFSLNVTGAVFKHTKLDFEEPQSGNPEGEVEAWSEIIVNGNITDQLQPNDCIIITGCTIKENNRSINQGGAPISEIEYKSSENKTHIIFMTEQFTDGTEAGTINLAMPVPDMDYICESENRIWGCSNATKTIYACALGDPRVWYDYSGESTDSYAVAVGSKGDFTGCTRLSSSVLFWKENTMHKMLGGYPAEYTMYTYEFEGVKNGAFRSIVLINEVMYYVSSKGIYRYSGGTPQKISDELNDIVIEEASAGSDGDVLYVSGKVKGEPTLFVYDLRSGIWLKEDETQVKQFVTLDGKVYALKTDGNVFCFSDEDATDIEWQMDFKPCFETVSGAYGSTAIVFAKKRYSKLIMRLDVPRGSRLTAYVRCDNGPWKECGTVTGDVENLRQFVVPINRCDKYELRLKGNGPCTILNLVRMYSQGSHK